MENEIRVVIADDQEGMRMILRKMIAKVEGFVLCAEADSGDKVMELVEKHKPHVCFLDVEMPGMTGIECAKAIQDTDPSPLCNGCWRGMFDLNTRQWGGGNRFEGGAASIYSGWTNAPISVALLLAREDRCLVDLL